MLTDDNLNLDTALKVVQKIKADYQAKIAEYDKNDAYFRDNEEMINQLSRIEKGIEVDRERQYIKIDVKDADGKVVDFQTIRDRHMIEVIQLLEEMHNKEEGIMKLLKL